MARLESVAVGGFYPTPVEVLPAITRFLRTAGRKSFAYLDPCAGDGAAILSVVEALHSREDDVTLFTIELEQTRHAALKENITSRVRDWRSRDYYALHGDAFKANWTAKRGVGLLWLNPPYDLDPQYGRLEEKFLTRFAPALGEGGVLAFLVPFYALKASAKTLAKLFTDVSCYRFPGDFFESYKQVVLFATRRVSDLWVPDPEIETQVVGWAGDPASIPELPTTPDRSFTIPSHESYSEAFEKWVMKGLDFKSLLASVHPWGVTDRGGNLSQIPGIVPEGALADLLTRKYPLAMPPRSAHIAAGIAAGIFNGARITPDDPNSKFPPILVKGVFDKEFRTVDEKVDKDGNVKGLIQVQQPKLVTTALDLSTNKYVTIKPSVDQTNPDSLDDMTMADLLGTYGRGLMDVMLQQCPVLHDPARGEDKIELPALARPLYQAQAQATMATIKLLGGLNCSHAQRKGKAAFVLGEIGSGKTSVALATAQAIGSNRVLVMCPPHLLTSWQDQIAAVVPWFNVVVLSDVGDVRALAHSKDTRPTIAILSRETAKLGHGYASVAHCGKCGAAVPADLDAAKKRARCEHRRLNPVGTFGRLVNDLIYDLFHIFPEDMRLRQFPLSRHLIAGSKTWIDAKKKGVKAYISANWERLVRRGHLDRLVDKLVASDHDKGLSTAVRLILADPRPELVFQTVRTLYAQPVPEYSYSDPDHIRTARSLLLVLPPSTAMDELIAELKEIDATRTKGQSSYYAPRDPWEAWQRRYDCLWHGAENPRDWDYSSIAREDGELTYEKIKVGVKEGVLDAFGTLASMGFRWSEECGEPLFQAIADPRRFPLATFICRYYPQLFDLLVLDEGHEYATDGSAQERSAHRLTSLGIPTLLLTGTVMNGYAESLFTNMWALSGDFRREFDRDDRSRFVDRYGYRKRLVEDKDKETGKVVEYGSMSDRVQTSERMIGDAPGVLPLFLLRYLLPMSVTLHKTDLSVDIPKCTEIVERVSASQKLADSFSRLQDTLLRQITKDRFEEDLSGKLWGALAELPSYLDLATEDVGNTDSGRYEIRYPDSVGGGLVASADPLPASTLLPKEVWMLDQVEASLEEGRNVMVFAWHTKLLPRLARLIEARTGEKCPVLIPAKVPTKKRETWINQEIVKKGRRVLVVNPVTVQTGLNNLIYFADEIWMENPACNPVTYRQAVGRVDRIGQQKPTRILFPLYQNTAQEELHSLLLQKVAVSMSTDGLDAESALQAAGVGDTGGFSTFAVGRQLYNLLMTRESRAA